MLTDREKALKKVQMCNFALIEANLFLDTHPNDKQALDYCKRNQQLFEKAKEAFVSKYGPLTASDISDDADSWEWVKGPWPWEDQANVELQ